MKKQFISVSSILMTLALVFFSADPAVAGTVTGQTLGPAFGPGPQLILMDGTVTNDGTNLAIVLNFSAQSAAPSTALGYVLLDTDQSTATGSSVSQLDGMLGLGLSQIPTAQIPSGLGVDYVVSLDGGGGATVDVVSGTTLLTLGSVPISYTSSSLSFSVPITLLTDPVAVDSLVNFAAIVGNATAPTDTLEGLVSSPVPEPTSLVMGFTGLILAGGLIRSQRGARK